MSNKLRFEKCSESEWDFILKNSNESNLFSKTLFLKNCGSKFHLWKVMQGNEIKAGVCLLVDNDEKESIENKFIIHNSIYFNLDKKRILPKIREDKFQITDFIIKNLTSKYKKIFLSLDPSFNDLRPFQWFNYDYEGPRFEISTKYTSWLDISEFKSIEIKNEKKSELFKNLEPVRRYSIRQAIKDNYNIEFSKESGKFIDLYRKFLSNNNSTEMKGDLEIISKIIEQLLEQDKGIITYIYSNTSELIYSMFTGWDETKAYYLYGVGAVVNKKSWQGTIGLWSILKYIAKNKNIKIFDFEGVNSPNRGWFKLGFGGDLISYYQIKYDKEKIYSNK